MLHGWQPFQLPLRMLSGSLVHPSRKSSMMTWFRLRGRTPRWRRSSGSRSPMPDPLKVSESRQGLLISSSLSEIVDTLNTWKETASLDSSIPAYSLETSPWSHGAHRYGEGTSSFQREVQLASYEKVHKGLCNREMLLRKSEKANSSCACTYE